MASQVDIFRTFPSLETERLILRQISMSDRAALFRIYSDPEVIRYNTPEFFDSISQCEQFILRIDDEYRRRVCIRWGVTIKEHGTVIGICDFHHWIREGLFRGTASIAYEMARVYWGRGYATEALSALITFGFARMDLYRIETNLLPSDVASAEMLTALGFQFEGIRRARAVWQDMRHDVRHFALLHPDWEPDSDPAP